MSQTQWRLPRRVAYVVSHARPWSSNGYAARTDAVARALARAGHEVIVMTRPGRPWDIEGFSPDAAVPLDRGIDGLRHICLPLPPLPGAKPVARIRAAADVLTEAFQAFRPAAVLAASNWETAEPARRAAGRTGAAFFYEQRGFWELGPGLTDKARGEAIRAETELAQGARAVFALGPAMRDELVRRGVPEGRIHLMPNGLSLRGGTGARGKPVTRAGLGITARFLVGYIGSLSDYEGVGDVIALVARLRQGEGGAAPLDVAGLIVGSDAPKGLIGSGPGPAQARLADQARAAGMADHIIFRPQLPEAEAAGLYPLLDAFILPRRRTAVTALVPPIKPYAAAAQGVPVFMTDLPPLAAIAAEIHGSLFPEGDIAALAAGVRRALTEGHPATVTPLDPALDWSQRVRPLSRHLEAVAEAERLRNQQIFGAVSAAAAAAVPDRQAGSRFDTAALPGVRLQGLFGAERLVLVGPPGAPSPAVTALGEARITRATRADLLDSLATGEPGRFVIDWAAIAAGPADHPWKGLWSISDMRLTRQIMDACRIALDRGWRIQVTGPVHRSEAPLYRTIARLAEEIGPDGAPLARETMTEGGA